MNERALANSREAVLALLAKADQIMTKSNVRSAKLSAPRAEDPSQIKDLIKQNEELLKTLNFREENRKKLYGLYEEVDTAEIAYLDCQHRLNERKIQLNQIRELWGDFANRISACCDEIQQIQDQIPVVMTQESEMVGFVESLTAELETARMDVKVKQELADQEQEKQVLKGELAKPLPPRQSKLKATEKQDRSQVVNKWSTQGSIVSPASPAKSGDASENPLIDFGSGEASIGGAVKSRIDYLWNVAYLAIKLKMLENPPVLLRGGAGDQPSPRKSLNDLPAMSATAKRLSRVMNVGTALNQISDLQFEIRRLSDEAHLRRHQLRDSEHRLAALSDRHEKLRVELAALRKVNSEYGDKTFDDLRADIRFYERERATLYAQLYRNKPFELPPVVPIYLDSAQLTGEPASPTTSVSSKLSTPPPQAASPAQSPEKRGMQQAIATAKKQVEERLEEFNKPPFGGGYLQRVIDSLKQQNTALEFKTERLVTKMLHVQHKLQVAENMAMFNFDAYLRGRQTVEEEMEKMMMEHQRAQAKLITKGIRDREESENIRKELEKRVDSLMRENASVTYKATSLEEQLNAAQRTIASLRDDVGDLTSRMATAESKLSQDELKPLDEFLQTLRNFSPSSVVSSDTYIARILPMAAQRSVASHVTNMLTHVSDGLIQVSGLLRGLCKDSIRASSLATQTYHQLLAKLVSMFETVQQPLLTTGKVSFEMIEQWFSQYKACLVSEETHTLDFPHNEILLESSTIAPTEVIVYQAPPPPETADFSEQAGRPFVFFQSRSLSSQTTATEVRSVFVSTDMVLGTGAGSEQSGFVSKERLQKLEDHYKSLISNTQKQLGAAEKVAGVLAKRLRISEIQSMASQDTLAKCRVALDALNTENRKLKVKPSVSDIGTETDVLASQPFSSQIYFPETDEERFLKLSNTIVSGESVSEYFPPPLTKVQEFASILVQATAPMVEAGADAPVIAVRSVSSVTDLDLKDISDLENKKAASSALPPIVPLKHTAVETDQIYIYSDDMEKVVDALHIEMSERVTAERMRLELILKSRIDAIESKEASAALSTLHMEEAKQFIQAQKDKVAEELAELARRRAALDAEQREHQNWVEEQARAVAEKGTELERTDQERQRKALVLHAHVSDMQTGFEAIDASVARYKFLDKENADLRKELEQEREKLNSLQQQLLARRASSRGGSGTAGSQRDSIHLDSIISIMTKNPQREEDLIETLKEAQKKMKLLQKERDDFKVKAENERIRASEIEKQLILLSGPPAAATFSIGRSTPLEDSKREEHQAAAKIAALKAELVQLKATLAASEKAKDDLRETVEAKQRDTENALDKACAEKKHLKKELDSCRADRDAQVAELQRQMQSNERVLLDELESNKIEIARWKSLLNDANNTNIALQKEHKKLLHEIEELEGARKMSQSAVMLGKRLDSAYKHLLSTHWKALEVAANIRKYVAAAAPLAVSSSDIGNRVASLLAAGGVVEEELGDAARRMANEDLDLLVTMGNTVRTFAERFHPPRPQHSPPQEVTPSPRPVSGMTPWSGSVADQRSTPPRSRERLPAVGGKTASDWFGDPAFARAVTPPRVPEKLVEVLASIPDQPSVTIPQVRPMLQPLDLSIQPRHGTASATNKSSPAALFPSRQLQHVIHDGMPKRVGSSHQALTAKHRQIIQARNDRDL